MFVCYGNICRSPMAEFLMKDYVKKKGKEKDFLILSRATSMDEIGNPVYPPVRRLLNSLGINCNGKVAERLQKEDYDKYDYFLIMDEINARGIKRIFAEDKDNKIKKLLDFSPCSHDIADPYYSGDFDLTYQEITKGIEYFYNFLMKKR